MSPEQIEAIVFTSSLLAALGPREAHAPDNVDELLKSHKEAHKAAWHRIIKPSTARLSEAVKEAAKKEDEDEDATTALIGTMRLLAQYETKKELGDLIQLDLILSKHAAIPLVKTLYTALHQGVTKANRATLKRLSEQRKAIDDTINAIAELSKALVEPQPVVEYVHTEPEVEHTEPEVEPVFTLKDVIAKSRRVDEPEVDDPEVQGDPEIDILLGLASQPLANALRGFSDGKKH